jgi:hypothetical protein
VKQPTRENVKDVRIAADPHDRMGRGAFWACLAAMAAGVFLSLIAPCSGYCADQDRDFYRAAQLVKGDLSVVQAGHNAPILGSTGGGTFYAIIAPFAAISRDAEWLYMAVAFLCLLAAVPAWFLFEFLCGRKTAWIATALYVVSSARIFYGNHGLHSFLSATPAMFWHLLLLKYHRRVWALAMLLACLVLMITLHLSSLPMVVAGPLVIVIHYWATWPKKRRYALVGAVMLALTVVLWWKWRLAGYLFMRAISTESVREPLLRVANMCTAVAEHSGFVTEGLHYSAWVYVTLPVVFLGALHLFSRRCPVANGESPDVRMDKLRLMRTWCTVMLCVQILGALAMVPEWRESYAFQPYRQLLPITPVLQLLLAFGVLRLCSWVPGHRKRRIALPAIIIMIAVGHILALRPTYLDQPWRCSGRPAICPSFNAVLSHFIRKWGLTEQWVHGACYIEPFCQKTPLPPYLASQLVNRHARGRTLSAGPQHQLILCELGSESEACVRRTYTILEEFRAEPLVGFLCLRSTKAALPLRYAVYRWSGHAYYPPVPALVSRSRRDEAGTIVFVAGNCAPPESLHGEFAFDIVIEKEQRHLVVQARLLVDAHYPYDNDVLRGPYVEIVRAGSGETVRIDIPLPQGKKNRLYPSDFMCLAQRRVLRGWSARDVGAVRYGVDYFIDPSHEMEGKAHVWSVPPP